MLAISNMSDKEKYEAASDLFDVDPDMCIAQTKKTFNHFDMSPYYIIENILLIDALTDMAGAEKEEGKEKGKDKADIGAVMAAYKDTLEPPRALPLRSKSGTHNKGGAANAHEFTKSLGRSSGKTPFTE
jgi:hypothetical protein